MSTFAQERPLTQSDVDSASADATYAATPAAPLSGLALGETETETPRTSQYEDRDRRPEYPEPTDEEVAFFSQAEAQAVYCGRVLVITNISKLPNIMQLILLAKANRFVPVLVNMKKTDTSSLMDRNVGPFFRLKDMSSLRKWLDTNNVNLLLGIEIMDTAKSVHDPSAFQQRMALMPGNEGTGLSPAQKAVCNGYVIIPQYGTATASLNVHVATCVVLYRYTCWLPNTESTEGQ